MTSPANDVPPCIRLRPGGPAVVPADVPIVRTGARTTQEPWATRGLDVPDDDRGNVALCRCGGSGTRPFCDGTHRGREVGADDRVEPTASAAAGPSGLPACLALEDDGPVRLCGGVAVRLPDGDTTVVADGVGLCRCGHSATRPWCDGSHAEVGFSESG